MAARTILIADPEAATSRTVAPALRARGFQVHAALDGSRALELSVLRHPDLILFDEACPLITGAMFLQILKSNPRTDRIPVLLTGTREGDPGAREHYLQKPYNLDELLASIDRILRRREPTPAEAPGPEKEIQGQLSHISVADLLQVFAMNRKSGRLSLRSGDELAEILVVDGKVHDARGPRISGEKALFRYLSMREGTFDFQPGRFPTPDRIRRTVDDVLLEGMRQNDERGRLASSLPPLDTELVLAVDPHAIADQHPVVAEVLRIVAAAGGITLQRLLDRAAATDAETAQAVASLLARGFLKPGDGAREAAEPALALDRVHALRQRLLRGRSTPPRELGTKVIVAGSDTEALARADVRLATLPGWVPEPDAGPWGTTGRIFLGEGVRVDLVRVPTSDALRPLWRPLSHGALGALILDPGPSGAALGAWFTREHHGPVVTSPIEAPVEADVGVREVLRRALAR